MLGALVASGGGTLETQKSPRYTSSLGVKGSFDLNIPGKWTSIGTDVVLQ